MDDFKNTPASMRYLGARLKPFNRPMFWGSIGLVTLIGVALYEYWLHPDWISGNLSEIPTATNDSTSSLSNLANEGQISAEDLAIGAELDNLDLLLKELEQNQTLPISETLKKGKSGNSLPVSDKNTTYKRFQEQQKSKLTRSPDPLFPNKNKANNLVESPTRGIFQLPKANGYNSTLPPAPPVQSSNTSNPELIPNPIGRLYLSNPNRLGSTATVTTPSNSVNLVSPPNSTSVTPNTETSNNSNVPTATTGVNPEVNPGVTNTFVTPSVLPYTNNTSLPTRTPTPTYGQPLYPPSANVEVNPGVTVNPNVNVVPSRFPTNNLGDRQQAQREYQLSPSNYQLQPQIYNNRSNINTGYNSQPSNFSGNGGFENSAFDNN